MDSDIRRKGENQKVRLIRPFIFRFVGRLIPAYLFVSLLFYLLGPLYVKIFLPLFPFPIKLIYPEYKIESVRFDQEKKLIVCKFIIQGNIINDLGTHQRAEIHMETHILPSALYVFPILLFSIQLAWPGIFKKDRLIAIITGLPFLFIVEMIDIPLSLINKLEHKLFIDSVGQQFRLFLIYFFNNGGRQFTALIVGIITVGIVRIKDIPVIKLDTHRNAPCPCGSGKKYKKCCM